MEDCSVCCLSFNRSSRKEVSCKCGYKCCMACAVHYIKDTVDAHCMNCRVGWNREFLDNNFTKTFINNDYKKHRQNMLFDRERSMLPETQHIVAALVDVNRVFKETVFRIGNIELQLLELYKELNKLSDEQQLERIKNPNYDSVSNILNQTLFDDKMIEINKEIAALRFEKKKLDARLAVVRSYIKNPNLIIQIKVDKKEKSQFVRACPGENCKGFLSTAWKCGLCHINVCSKCHEIKHDDHVCNEDTVKTVELMKQDTRNCPKCAANIFKISGCNQIWCTQCHTAFDFRTGAIETVIHNPHYYEYLRQTGQQIPRAIGDNPGGGNCELLDVYTLIYNAGQFCNRRSAEMLLIEEFERFRTHVNLVEVPRFETTVNRATNLDLRVRYMLNDLEESRFKELLQQREKKNQKKHDFLQVINMYLLVSRDILLKMRDVRSLDDAKQILNELNNLVEYFNKSTENVAKIYKCVPPKIKLEGRFLRFIVKNPKKTTDTQ